MWDTPEEMRAGTVYYGDNRKWLERWKQHHGLLGLFDLIYLDPPFNSNADYLFDKGSGGASAQMKAFSDTWRWTTAGPDNAADRVERLCAAPHPARQSIAGFRSMIGEGGMLAYLSYMAERLALLRDLLKETGSIYLHCDPTASHYLKCVMDDLFGPHNFRNEITWKRAASTQKGSQHAPKQWGNNTDIILFYAKSKKTPILPYRKLTEEETAKKFDKTDDDGRKYRDDSSSLFRAKSMGPRPNLCYEWKGFCNPSPAGWRLSKERLEEEYQKGNIVIRKDGKLERRQYQEDYPGIKPGNLWDDILPALGKKRTGHPTEKPLPLMERIIKASSNEGDLVLDPFCGCGPFLEAGARLGRRIVGIDVSLLAIETITFGRLEDAGVNVQIRGIPEDFESACRLAKDDPFEFERWAVQACTPGMSGNDQQRKDGGVDGMAKLLHQTSDGQVLVIAQATKSRKPSIDKVKAFAHEIKTRSEVAAGVFITLHQDSWTTEMQKVADSLGVFKTNPNSAEEFPILQHWHVRQRYNKKFNLTPRLPEIGHPIDGKELPVKRGWLFRK